MGALAFLIILCGVVGFALFLIIGSIITAVIIKNRRKKGEPYSRALEIASRIVFSVGIFILLIPASFITMIVYANFSVPEDFVETEIVIEEGDNLDSFTADGVTYELLDHYSIDLYSIDLFYSDADAEAVFSYKPSGLLNRIRWRNYYVLENSCGFDMVWSDMGGIFAPSEQIEEIMQYYSSCNFNYYIVDGETDSLIPLNEELTEFISKLDYTNFQEVRIEVSDFPDSETIYLADSDRLFWREKHQYRFIDGYVYLEHTLEYNENGNLELWGKKLPYAHGKKIIDNLYVEND